MKFAYDIIKKPVITERSMMGAQDNKYTFEVAVDAGKIEIKKAVEEIFGVKVAKVNTIKLPGKWKRMGVHVGKRPDIKKAVVTLTADVKCIGGTPSPLYTRKVPKETFLDTPLSSARRTRFGTRGPKQWCKSPAEPYFYSAPAGRYKACSKRELLTGMCMGKPPR